jgi:hypothetical protein
VLRAKKRQRKKKKKKKKEGARLLKWTVKSELVYACRDTNFYKRLCVRIYPILDLDIDHKVIIYKWLIST